MLQRLADSCFWLGRYTERAVHVARVVGATQDLSLGPDPGAAAFVVACAATGTGAVPAEGDPAAWLVCGEANPSSLAACMRALRENARAARPLIGDDLWECANAAWLHVQPLDPAALAERGVAETCAEAIGHIRRVHGAVDELQQDEAAAIIRIGFAAERLDAICRLIAAALAEGGLPARAEPASAGFRRWRWLVDAAGAAHHLRVQGVPAGDLAGACRVLIADERCPLSVAAARAALHDGLRDLGGAAAAAPAAAIAIPSPLPGPGLHQGLMAAIAAANQLCAHLQAAGFPTPAPAPTQSQRQS